MGRKTWESLNKKPLPNRFNIVISSKRGKDLGVDNHPELAMNVGSLEEAIEASAEMLKAKESFLIGGNSIYSQAEERIEDCKNVFKTRIGQNIEGDIKFEDKDLLSNMYLTEMSKTFAESDLNFDFARYINPNLFSEHFEEFNTKFFEVTSEEYQYLELIEKILKSGADKSDRTGTGTISTFGNIMRFDLSNSFPLLTTKRVFWKGVVEELLWFLRGCTDSKELSKMGVRIWDANGSREFLDKNGFSHRDEGDLGPVYGFQWRHAGAEYIDHKTDYSGKGVDQIKEVIDLLNKDPNSRRMIVCAWNVKDISQMALPPCHTLFQFYTANGKLSCLLYQRSCDVGLGLPFNIASYSLLTCLVAKMVNMEPGEFVHMIGDTHIYKNHVDALREQISRKPNPFPILNINYQEGKPIENYTLEDFELKGYWPQKKIKMEMSA